MIAISFKRNLLASYAGQLYVTLAGIMIVPVYVRHMGTEAYGLVGFYVTLQMCFLFLDMGLTPTMARETARYRGGATDALSVRRLLRTLEGIFIGIALLGALAMIMGAGAIADGWLKVQRLPLEEVRRGIMLMAIIVALRWIGGLYRGAISGFEQLVWLSGLDVAIMTVRVVMVVPLFIYIGTSPTDFFSFQLVLAVIELLLLADRAYRLLPRAEIGQRVAWQWESLRAVLKFAVSSSFVGSLWVLATQTDKLLLSKLLPLTDYGHFTLGVLLASGVTVISAPISAALLPRLTRLSAEGDDAGMVRLYRNATQLVGVIAVPAALVLAFFAEQVLWAWTGDPVIVRGAAPVLVLYALGNGVLALGAFAYYLQFAKGDLKLHLICNTLFVVLLIPALIWATSHYGVAGAGYAWVGSNTAFFLLCMPKVHRRFVKGLHRQWLLHDVSGIILATAAGAVLVDRVATWPRDRLSAAIEIAVVSAVLVAIAATGSSWARQKVIGRWSERSAR